jgi:predicted nucleic acid-binding protein
LSTQVLQELCVNLRRCVAHPLPSSEIAKLVEDYLSWEIVINTPQAIVAALGIEERYKVSYWDALILHAAESCGAAVLYTEDLSHGQRYGAVEVVDPVRG